jgi:Chlorophyllase enzyme
MRTETRRVLWGLAAAVAGASAMACMGGSATETPDASSSPVEAGMTGDSSSPPPPAEAASDSGTSPQGSPSADSGAAMAMDMDGGAPSTEDSGPTVTPDGGTRYGSDGPISYTTAALPVTNGADAFTVNVWVPGTSGMHPVVSFSPGLEQPSTGYTPYATRLASWGFVVLMRDDPGILVSGDTVAADLAYTVGTWLPAQNTTAGSVLFGEVDLTRVGLAGHSRGGQTTLVAAEEGLHGMVEAWVGLDPVDTAYSAGTAPSTNLPSIGIPTLYIGAGVPTNCAPTDDNYTVLYAVSPSPSVAIVVANASHSQFEDVGNCSICGLLCSPMGTANSQAVLDLAIRYLTADFARLLLGDTSVGSLFQGAGAPADEASGAITMMSK